MSGTSVKGFPGGSDGRESACGAGDWDLIPGSGRSPGGGHGNPHQYSCLENPMDRGAWRATVHGVTKNRTRLNDQHIGCQFEGCRDIASGFLISVLDMVVAECSPSLCDW